MDPTPVERAARDGGGAGGASSGRRLSIAMHVLVACLLAGGCLLLLNRLAHRFHVRVHLSAEDALRLSDKTGAVLAGVTNPVRVVSLFRRRSEFASAVRLLLDEYQAAAEARGVPLKTERMDPERDLGEVRRLRETYDLPSGNVLLVAAEGGRYRVIEEKALTEYEYTPRPDGNFDKRLAAFLGERELTSALLSVQEARSSVVYFTTGHGERDIDDFRPGSGYSSVGRMVRRENIEVRRLASLLPKGVPADADALVIAGPTHAFQPAEEDALHAFLERKGRILLLAGGGAAGLEALLGTWGIEIGNEVAVNGPEIAAAGLTLGGRETIVVQYGTHPAVRRLRNVATVFFTPRAIWRATPREDEAGAADLPQVAVLAATTDSGWAEADPADWPPRFDAARDRRGPVAVAVAVERRTGAGVDVGLRPARLVVVGDATFVGNDVLREGVAANGDFFMGCLNWLLHRDALVAVAPRYPGRLVLSADPRTRRTMLLATVLAIPGSAALLGLFIAWLRRN